MIEAEELYIDLLMKGYDPFVLVNKQAEQADQRLKERNPELWEAKHAWEDELRERAEERKKML